jgi:hypothetical protein
MSFPSELNYNPKVSYPLVYKDNPITQDFLMQLTITVSNTESFEFRPVQLLGDTSSPKTFTHYAQVQDYLKTASIDSFKNQLKFALFYATSGCGVSWNNHINHKDAFVRSIFRFHVYFTMRKILHQLKIPLPGNTYFKSENNPYDKQVYEILKHDVEALEFNYFKTGEIKIMMPGVMTMSGAHFLTTPHNFPFRADGMNYADMRHRLPIERLTFIHSDDWTHYIPMDGEGFTRVGIVRLNDTIRTYIYCILGSQAQTRSPIVGRGGTSLDAQKQFRVLLEDSINQSESLSLPEMINRYEDAITHTHKRLDYAIGPSLYMIPSDLILKMGKVEGYNNNIKIATTTMKFGVNEVNSDKITSKKLPPLSEISDKVNRINKTPSSNKEKQGAPQPQVVSTSHEDNKAMLALGLGTVVGLGVFYFKR